MMQRATYGELMQFNLKLKNEILFACHWVSRFLYGTFGQPRLRALRISNTSKPNETKAMAPVAKYKKAKTQAMTRDLQGMKLAKIAKIAMALQP